VLALIAITLAASLPAVKIRLLAPARKCSTVGLIQTFAALVQATDSRLKRRLGFPAATTLRLPLRHARDGARRNSIAS
jgi:hypothetical protein